MVARILHVRSCICESTQMWVSLTGSCDTRVYASGEVCMKVFSLLLTLYAFLGNYWTKMKFSVGTLIMYCCRSTSYRIRENGCMPPYIC